MGYRILKAAEAKIRSAGVRRVRKPWRSKPASDAPRCLLGSIGFWIVRHGLTAAHKRQQLTLSRVRRAVATVATTRKRLELEIAQVEQQVGELGGPDGAGTGAGHAGDATGAQAGPAAELRLADLRARYADIQAKEGRLAVACRRLQAEVNAFRADTEAVETAYIAAAGAAKAFWAEATGPGDADGEGTRPARR
jgi:hypothetical protein